MKISRHITSRPMQLSAIVLYTLVGLAAVVFGAFYLIGFDMPYLDDPNFNEPLLTGLLLGFLALLVVGATATAIASVVITARRRAGEGVLVNGIPARRIALSTGGGLVACLLLTFVAASSSPIAVNGTVFSDRFWLRVADMFILTSIILLLVAVIIVVCSNARNIWSRR
jgi:hypothetical protein